MARIRVDRRSHRRSGFRKSDGTFVSETDAKYIASSFIGKRKVPTGTGLVK